MRTLWIAAALSGLASLLATETARAQFILGRPGGAVVARNGFSVNFQGRHVNVVAFASRTTIVGFGSFYAGGFYGFPPPWYGPAVVFVPQPIVVVQPIVIPVVAEQAVVADPDRFLVIRPERAKVQPAAPPPAQVEKKPKDPAIPPLARVEKKVKEVDLGIQPGAFPLARGPAANPRIEVDRQIESGRDAFNKGEFGRAAERFRQATSVLPNEATAWFLLAQALFAVGKYDEAAASIATGLQHQPDWPSSRFRSRDVYQANPVAFDIHLQDLRNALAADPDNPQLLFLLGVQLWFDGRRDDARPLFTKAAARAKDPGQVGAFNGIKD